VLDACAFVIRRNYNTQFWMGHDQSGRHFPSNSYISRGMDRENRRSSYRNYWTYGNLF
jgi:hypothetical protein